MQVAVPSNCAALAAPRARAGVGAWKCATGCSVGTPARPPSPRKPEEWLRQACGRAQSAGGRLGGELGHKKAATATTARLGALPLAVGSPGAAGLAQLGQRSARSRGGGGGHRCAERGQRGAGLHNECSKERCGGGTRLTAGLSAAGSWFPPSPTPNALPHHFGAGRDGGRLSIWLAARADSCCQYSWAGRQQQWAAAAAANHRRVAFPSSPRPLLTLTRMLPHPHQTAPV